MRALVTGGCGFIGSHVVDALVERGYEVVVIDDLSAGQDFSNSATVMTYIADVSTPFPDWGEQRDFDVAVSLASPVSVPVFVADSVKTIETNVASARLCCDAVRAKDGVAIFFSTCDAYGQQYGTLREDMPSIFNSSLSRRFSYGLGKLAGEAIMFSHAYRGLSSYAIRLFKTFGPRESTESHLTSTFISRALRDEPMPVFGDGSQRFSISYVDDVVDAVLRIIDVRPRHIGPINVGGVESFSVNEFALLTQRLLESSSPIETQPMPDDRPNDPPARLADLTLAYELLNWKPRISVADGIQRTAEFYRAQGSPVPVRDPASAG